MFVSKTITLDIEDIRAIKKAVDEEKVTNVSNFVQRAVKNELKRMGV